MAAAPVGAGGGVPKTYLSKPITKVFTEKGRGPSYEFAVGNCQGWRVTQEDAHMAHPKFVPDHTALFGIFDGHGGSEVAKWVATKFPDYLKANLKYKQGHIERGIQETFMELDQTLDRKLAMEMGSTGVVLLLSNDIYYCANVGDSRCVVARSNNPDGQDVFALELSQDHKPTSEQEKSRIEKAGGTVINGRINGIIDVSRTFGDRTFKLNSNLNEKDQMITAWPHTKIEPIKLKNDRFVVLMCDGIWNALTNQEVVNHVQLGLAKKMELDAICTEIIKTVLSKTRGPAAPTNGIAGLDNMTIMIVKPMVESHTKEPAKEQSKCSKKGHTNSAGSSKASVARSKSSIKSTKSKTGGSKKSTK